MSPFDINRLTWSSWYLHLSSFHALLGPWQYELAERPVDLPPVSQHGVVGRILRQILRNAKDRALAQLLWMASADGFASSV